LLMLVVLAISVYENFISQGGRAWKEVIASDGRGYYAYLPTVFIYHEIGFDSIVKREKEVYPSVQAANFIVGAEGRYVNKYFIGVALLMAPFFLAGSFISNISGIAADGYNSIYQLMASLSALFYLFLGLVFLRKLLRLYRIKDGIVNLVLVLILFATNLLIYTVAAPAMSHVYSFAALAGFMYFAARYFREEGRGNTFLAVLFLSIVVLIRPVNALVILFLPALAPNFSRFISSFKIFFSSGWSYIFLMAGMALVTIQPIWWYVQTGNWLIWSYEGEGFYFSNPQFINVLFSFQKGLFIYTPLCFLALAGLVPMFRQGWAMGFFVLFFLLVYTWLVSSWWNWYYGDSFGQRVFIDVYPVFALLLAWFFTWISKNRLLYRSIMGLSIFLMGLNLLQSWQYSRGIIHPYAMDKEKYAMVFLRTGSEFRYISNGLEDIPPYRTNLETPVRTWINDFEQIENDWVTSGRIEHSLAHDGDYVSKLNSAQQYSSALLITHDTSMVGKKALYARINAWIYELKPGSSEDMNLVISLADSADVNYYFKSLPVNEMPIDEAGYWRELSFGTTLPKINNPNDKLKIFFWYQGRADILVDDFSVELFGKDK